MIPNTKKTITGDFKTPAAALKHLNSRTQRNNLIQTHNIHLDKDGLLHHHSQVKAFDGLPLTDVAAEHLNSLVGITPAYSNLIDPSLHAHSVNQLLKKMDGSVSVVVSSSNEDSDNKHIAAILPGACPLIDDKVILERFEFWGVKAHVRLDGSSMDIFFGNPNVLEVLPEDHVQLSGSLRNFRWGQKAFNRPSLEVSVYWKRLICSNGAFIQRALATGRLMSLASKKEVATFIDAQIKRSLSFETTILLPAIEMMSQTIPNEEEHNEIVRLISRYAGAKTAETIISNTVSWWDEFNAVTSAANQVSNIDFQRKLQIKGGEMIEKFLVLN